MSCGETWKGTEMATILMLDDEPSFRDIFNNFLGEQGHNVLAASNGAEALQICRSFEGEIHLMVVDLILPDEDSREVAKQLKELRPQVPLLYISASRYQTLIDHGLITTEDEFLEKPFALNMLAETVQRLIG